MLIYAPRHNRNTEIIKLLEKNNLTYSIRSKNTLPSENCKIFLVDTIGELNLFYYIADVAIVCGTFTKDGHNPIRPLSLGVPTIIGPRYKNFINIVLELHEKGVISIVNDAEELASTIELFLTDNAPSRDKIDNFFNQRKDISTKLVKEILHVDN